MCVLGYQVLGTNLRNSAIVSTQLEFEAEAFSTVELHGEWGTRRLPASRCWGGVPTRRPLEGKGLAVGRGQHPPGPRPGSQMAPLPAGLTELASQEAIRLFAHGAGAQASCHSSRPGCRTVSVAWATSCPGAGAMDFGASH